MDCMMILEAFTKREISPRRIQILCGQSRIAGAVCYGCRSLAIPANAEKPADVRIKRGKYIK